MRHIDDILDKLRAAPLPVRCFFLFALPIEAGANLADGTIAADRPISDRAELARVQAAIAILPQAEASQILGISKKAVETGHYRARD